MSRVVHSPGSRADLNEIWDYIAADNVPAADRLAGKFDDAFALLADHPRIGRIRDEIGPEIRSFAVGNYVILYRAITDGVDIVRVVHGARDFGRLTLG